MSGPLLLFGVGATKAGTTWLYRRLAEHPDCALRTVKELHYFDSFAPRHTRQRVAVCRGQLRAYEDRLIEAAAASDAALAGNLARQVRDTEALIEVLQGDRADDSAYLAYLTGDAEGRAVAADITPAYASLPEDVLARMAALAPVTRFVYLVRDPLARVWSHVRMLAARTLGAGEDFAAAANRLLAGVLRDGADPSVWDRGDYAGAVARMRRAIPRDSLFVMFSEEALTQAGFDRLCAWLGIRPQQVPAGQHVHAGRAAQMDAGLAAEALARLAPQYDWAARELGALPGAWRASMARMAA